jgi:hypothetical protein
MDLQLCVGKLDLPFEKDWTLDGRLSKNIFLLDWVLQHPPHIRRVMRELYFLWPRAEIVSMTAIVSCVFREG